jgi:glycosyltransferase involved in cell wall biosynthesis
MQKQDKPEGKIRVIIYESSSFGGCYDYAIQLFNAYSQRPEVSEVSLILPKNASFQYKGVKHILLKDTNKFPLPLLSKALFLFRSLINPFILCYFLLKKPKSVVILNDFEQLTACIWAPVFKLLLKKKLFAVVLHDPDRDNFPPSKYFSVLSMKSMMSVTDLAFYHDYLPEKPYYKNKHTTYVSVPHGIYPGHPVDEKLSAWLNDHKSHNTVLMTVPGNIRKEKNYEYIIRAIADIQQIKLVIAGKKANSAVDINEYKTIAKQLGITEKVIFIEKFLSENELSALIEQSDIICLYYSASFHSQSAILHLIAPYKKKIIISDTNSSLTKICRKYHLGIIVPPDSTEELKKGIITSINNENINEASWQKYIEQASWQNHISIAMKHMIRKLNDSC